MPGTSCDSVLLAVTTSVFPLEEVTVAIFQAALRTKENIAAPAIPLRSTAQHSHFRWVFIETPKWGSSDGFRCLALVRLHTDPHCWHVQCTPEMQQAITPIVWILRRKLIVLIGYSCFCIYSFAWQPAHQPPRTSNSKAFSGRLSCGQSGEAGWRLSCKQSGEQRPD